jgi:hypothetical protein
MLGTSARAGHLSTFLAEAKSYKNYALKSYLAAVSSLFKASRAI